MIVSIGELIKTHRKARGLTLLQLAEVTGINHSNLSKIENDKQSLTNDTMALIADAFGLTLSQLFTHENYSFNKELDTINSKQEAKAGEIYPRPVKSFKSLKDITRGESVLIDRIKEQFDTEAEEGSDKRKWQIDKNNPLLIPGEMIRDLESLPVNLVAMHIPDDTMAPRLFTSDLVVIDVSDKTVPSTGGVFALVVDNRAIEIRRLFPKAGNGLTMVCDNDRYPTIHLTSAETAHITIIGRLKALLGSSGL